MIKAFTIQATTSLSKDICVGRREVRRPKKNGQMTIKREESRKCLYSISAAAADYGYIFSKCTR